MDLFIPLQSVSTLLVFLSPFSLRSFSSPCFLSYFPFCSWFTVNWWILHLYQVTRYCPALLLWLIPLPLFRKKSSYGGFCWWIQTHHCGEETLFFFSFTMSHLWAHFLFSFFFGSIFKGLDILWFIVRSRYLVFLLFLAQSSPNPWNILSDESNKIVFC